MIRFGQLVALVALTAVGCSVTSMVEPERLACDDNHACPVGFICLDGRCSSQETGSGLRGIVFESAFDANELVLDVSQQEGNAYLLLTSSRNHTAATAVIGSAEWMALGEQCAARLRTGVTAWLGVASSPDTVTVLFAEPQFEVLAGVLAFDLPNASAELLGRGNSDADDGCDGIGTDSTSLSIPIEAAAPGAQVYLAAALRSASLTPESGIRQLTLESANPGGPDGPAALAILEVQSEAMDDGVLEGVLDAEMDWAAAAFALE